MKIHPFYVFAGAIVALAALVLTGHMSPDLGAMGGLVSAMAVQSSYSARGAVAAAGMIADMQSARVDTRVCETAAGIGFGLAVGRGSADNGAVLGGTASTDFVGVSVRDVTLTNADGDEYARYANMAVLTQGTIWVTVGGDVVDGGDVTFNTSTGVLSSISADGSNFAVTGARWLDTVSSGGLARLRLGGALPSA